jgi:hypothetical protein
VVEALIDKMIKLNTKRKKKKKDKKVDLLRGGVNAVIGVAMFSEVAKIIR